MSCYSPFFVVFLSACTQQIQSDSNLSSTNKNIIYEKADQKTIQQLLQRTDLSINWKKKKLLDDGLQVEIQTSVQQKKFQLTIQNINSPPLLYIAIQDYLWLDQSQTPRSTSFTLTQLAVQNHAILGAKIQLNPKNGAITFAHEMHIPNGLNEQVFIQSINHLENEAVRHYPMLKASLEEKGY